MIRRYEFRLPRGKDEGLYKLRKFYAVESEVEDKTIYLSNYKRIGLYRDGDIMIFDLEDSEKIARCLIPEIQQEFRDVCDDIRDMQRMKITWYNVKYDVGLERGYKDENYKRKTKHNR